ncbi:flocculation protein FLO11-like [Cynara cardunculus var. scolymus]|uniref:flocculation protein FLO11-like n=1 Tax=Cynara cardunculus var. scolymus TaxID=59895 RepID=UPI000D6310DB|nr:flocculation protein FLO11-like [Cynara cardunculus var. scolymus]
MARPKQPVRNHPSRRSLRRRKTTVASTASTPLTTAPIASSSAKPSSSATGGSSTASAIAASTIATFRYPTPATVSTPPPSSSTQHSTPTTTVLSYDDDGMAVLTRVALSSHLAESSSTPKPFSISLSTSYAPPTIAPSRPISTPIQSDEEPTLAPSPTASPKHSRFDLNQMGEGEDDGLNDITFDFEGIPEGGQTESYPFETPSTFGAGKKPDKTPETAPTVERRQTRSSSQASGGPKTRS